MAKPDLIKKIIEEFPEKEFTAEGLDEDYTVPQLEELQETLGEEKQQEVESNSSASENAGNKKENKIVKLKDPSTQYAEKGFTLAGKQEKELPSNPSTELIDRIEAGFIVEVK
ncbi:hypothetical protein SAMN05421743_105215 [Thalassobacillus cyri]|uniref:Uncharacterized protein n=1 Tax=Thalassobacillus cyri TaxID=571932 RepID=A0A1H4C087_9BACI|nr:hypothetical protein [Thalassobacillus cyri]SEA53759.1 hypothetical protein SAMN05421743_105215 [Thalassobacillus cyri]